MPDTWPEPYATIAQMRRARCSEADIAAHLDLTPFVLGSRAKRWERDNPDNPLPPMDAELRQQERADILTRLTRGESIKDVAAATGSPLARVLSLYDSARKRGVVPPRRQPPQTAYEVWQRQRALGAAPAGGTIPDVLRALEPACYDRLLRRHATSDGTLAATIAALLKDLLHE